MPERIPPGRAGRLWLAGRIATAARSVELLDRKRQLLRRTYDRLHLAVEERRRAFDAAGREAARWGLRAAALGGESDLAAVARSVAGTASVTVSWTNTMGVVHPEDARCRMPELPAIDVAAGNAASAPTVAAYRAALAGAVAMAVAESACALVGDELRLTQRRLRAVKQHRLPALTTALDRLEATLDESERQDRVVERWAQRRAVGRR